MADLPTPILRDFIITRSRVSEQIADALQEAIVSGRLKPGARLRESALASEIGVSRNTVREAVLILQRSGLIDHEVNRGMIVRALDIETVADLYRARETLELAGVRASAGADLAPVRQALAELDEAAHHGSVKATVERDLGFHAALVGLVGSARLDEYFAGLRSELRYYLATLSVAYNETERPADLVEQHACILRALEAGDRRTAATRTREHVRLNGRQVTDLLRSRDGG
ncbi:MAG TPA: GntR family transcriptional regulator [Solirubrobacteraceae bacterium]|nr:GntR family transcriptional regulator [Solirubrobacteraceae bacterium]